MDTITIRLADERLSKLKAMAEALGVTPEALVHMSVVDLLAKPQEAFEETAQRVLDKNAALYERLA
jgi:predicted transcriptional regulator